MWTLLIAFENLQKQEEGRVKFSPPESLGGKIAEYLDPPELDVEKIRSLQNEKVNEIEELSNQITKVGSKLKKIEHVLDVITSHFHLSITQPKSDLSLL